MQILLLAVIQGLTEFLPVSSSGHLVLVGHMINFSEQGNTTEVILHTGTFLAVIIFFWKRLLSLATGTLKGSREDLSYVGALAVGCLPVIAAYFLAGDTIESLFDKPCWAAAFLCVTGIMLLSLKLARGTGRDAGLVRGLLVGIAQAVALLPGISRSGSTIVAARHLGISPEKAAEFSFLLYLPAMLGAIAIKTSEMISGKESFDPILALVGIAVSAAVGYLSLALLIRMVSRGKLWIFGIYCLAVGAVSTAVLIF